MVKNPKSIAYLIFSVLIIFGCTSTPKTHIGKDYDFNKHATKSIVFGKIDVKTKGVTGFPTYNAFHLKNAFTGQIVLIDRFSRDEYFLLALEPGEYEIAEIGLGFGLMGAIGDAAPTRGDIVPVNLRFKAIPGEVIYIGKLFVECTINPRLPGNVSVIDKRLVISDEYEIAEKEFRDRYSNIHKEIKKNLMR
jgi:hypothetical protein